MMTTMSGERTIPIHGVRVHFPYKPYPSQLSMMAKIISGIEKQDNCLLESPTGTGKSLALLCSALAWQQQNKLKLEQESDRKLKEKQTNYGGAHCGCKCHLGPSKTDHGPSHSDHGKVPSNPSRQAGHVTSPTKPTHVKSEQNVSTAGDVVADNGDDVIKGDDDIKMAEVDDDFKEEKKQYRTPINSRRRSHMSIQYEDTPTKPNPDISPETRAWKMEVTTAVGRDLCGEMEKDGSVTSVTRIGDLSEHPVTRGQCHLCECAHKAVMDCDQDGEKLKYPRIYYGTRTHRQLSQIAKELGRTAYRNTRMTILAAKRHTCIHSDVMRSSDVNQACRDKLDVGSCKYHEKSKLITQTNIEMNGLGGAWDLEDLIGLCHQHNACPYFGSRELRNGAEIIFCPYNYLLDPNIRESMDISLDGEVIILDEAHNVEDTARDAASFTISHKQLINTVSELDTMFQANVKPEVHLDLKSLCSSVLDFIEKSRETMDDEDFNGGSKVYSGHEIVAALTRMSLIPHKIKHYKKCVSEACDDVDSNGHRARMKMSSATQRLVKGLLQVVDYIYRLECKYLPDYRLSITRTTTYTGHQSGETWLSKGRAKRRNLTYVYSLNFWCLNPAVSFSDLCAARCVVLTSGTLAPTQTFQSELGIPFPIQLEANHVIDNNQVWVGAVGRGPQNKSLLATYQNGETLEFQDEVGRVVLDVCKTIPHGVLCFVSSYKMLDKLRDRWTSTGMWDNLQKIKGVYCEPRSGDVENFDDVIKDYYYAVSLSASDDPACRVSGGLLFAVCRGKLSEGIDFSDNKARAVIVVGIPYPNVKDPLVNLKRDYNNKYSRERGLLSGGQWYEIQAYRALNQALGRCIRHRHDWGALILLDERFAKTPERHTKGISKWLRSRVQQFSCYSEVQESLESFTRLRQQTKPTDYDHSSSQCADVSLHSQAPPISPAPPLHGNKPLDSPMSVSTPKSTLASKISERKRSSSLAGSDTPTPPETPILNQDSKPKSRLYSVTKTTKSTSGQFFRSEHSFRNKDPFMNVSLGTQSSSAAPARDELTTPTRTESVDTRSGKIRKLRKGVIYIDDSPEKEKMKPDDVETGDQIESKILVERTVISPLLFDSESVSQNESERKDFNNDKIVVDGNKVLSKANNSSVAPLAVISDTQGIFLRTIKSDPVQSLDKNGGWRPNSKSTDQEHSAKLKSESGCQELEERVARLDKLGDRVHAMKRRVKQTKRRRVLSSDNQIVDDDVTCVDDDVTCPQCHNLLVSGDKVHQVTGSISPLFVIRERFPWLQTFRLCEDDDIISSNLLMMAPHSSALNNSYYCSRDQITLQYYYCTDCMGSGGAPTVNRGQPTGGAPTVNPGQLTGGAPSVNPGQLTEEFRIEPRGLIVRMTSQDTRPAIKQGQVWLLL